MSVPPFDWKRLCEETLACYDSEFMREMLAERARLGTAGSMGRLDAAILFALVKISAPRLVVETGSHTGMSSAFILHALRDTDAELHTIDRRGDSLIAALVPDNLRRRMIRHAGEVRDVVNGGAIPARIDFFLHDSTHRYQYQRWELETFWPRVRSGGIMASHDVDRNASFADFVSRTYAHDDGGVTDPARTEHRMWGVAGTVGFVVKQ